MNILALDIGGTFVKAGSFRNGEPADFAEFPTEAEQGAVHMVDRVCGYIRGKSPDCVGISTSGLVEPGTGRIAFATDAMPGYSGFPLLEYVRQETGCPAVVENDANCAAVGEANFGAARGLSDFLCVTYGTGVGGGVYLNGKLFTGYHGLAAEIGHIVTHADGPRCSCGQRGCYEMYASTGALVGKAAEKGLARNGSELYARRENAEIARILDAWCDEVVAGLVSLARVYDPQAIILGGGLMTQTELVSELHRRFSSQVSRIFSAARLIPAELGNQAGVYGAYVLARDLLHGKNGKGTV